MEVVLAIGAHCVFPLPMGIATSVLTSLKWLVNLSYNLYMISFLQNYPEVTQFSTSQNCSQPIEHNKWAKIPLLLSLSRHAVSATAMRSTKDSPVMAG